MKEIRLNDYSIPKKTNGYRLDPKEKYVIDLKQEIDFQIAVVKSYQEFGYPPAIKNYHAWLYENGFSQEAPCPTNDVVAPYYGEKPLWITPYSQGIAVKVKDDDDFYIVMECSEKNKGYKSTQIIVTLLGCNDS